jgi:hypothetical protein
MSNSEKIKQTQLDAATEDEPVDIDVAAQHDAV